MTRPRRMECLWALVVVLPGLGDAAWAQADEPHFECQILFSDGAAGAYQTNTWPGGVVPYIFNANVTPANQQLAINAMAVLEAVAGIDFIPRTNQPDYLHIQTSSGNSSYVGLQGGPQPVNIFSWSFQYVIVHELMHALGFNHEHQRPDRDTYIQINYENVLPQYAFAFNLAVGSQLHGSYDFDSVMHYGQCAFAQPCPNCSADPSCHTITVLPPNQAWQGLIGQLTHLSDGDKAGLRFLYCSQWTQITGTAPSPRYFHDMCFDSERQVAVLMGGYNGSYLSDTWEWNGSTWTLRATGGISPHSDHTLTYDIARAVSVLYGGLLGSGVYSSQTWEWDGQAWVQRLVTGPPARESHSASYDSARGKTVVFGGYRGGGLYVGDTWEWDGETWLLRSSSGPSIRALSTMTYDSKRKVSVLFGGWSGTAALGDTWEWDGVTWTQRSSAGPAARYGATMAYDSSRGVTLLFGGFSTGYLNDVWEWDGETWLPFPQTGPSARYQPRIVYDSARQTSILFGGYVSGVYLGDTWQLKSGQPTITQQPSSQAAQLGQAATFSVVAGGDSLLSYQWRHNGVELSNGGPISGSTSSTLVINPVQNVHVGNYDVIVSSGCGFIASEQAALNLMPPNNNCAGATVALAGSSYPFTTVHATTDGPDEPAGCNFNGHANITNDIWYLFPAQCTGTVTVSLCGANYDSKLAVYGLNCPGTTSGLTVACNDAFCGDDAQVSFPVTAGQGFRFRVGGFNGATGSGTMVITCTPGGLPCPADISGDDGLVNVDDLLMVINNWNAPGGPADVNEDGLVNVDDLLAVINAWGVCR